MSVPGRVESASLLLSLRPPAWFLRHSRAVAEIAGWLASRVEARGGHVDRRLVEAAALLHDLDKALPPDDPANALPHGEGSAAWLERRGHVELAEAVVAHPITRLRDEETADRLVDSASVEVRIVAYADKRAGQRLESMDGRFAGWARRYPEVAVGGRAGWGTTELRAVRARAERLEAGVCAVAGIRPDEVRRLRWTGDALRAAARAAR